RRGSLRRRADRRRDGARRRCVDGVRLRDSDQLGGDRHPARNRHPAPDRGRFPHHDADRRSGCALRSAADLAADGRRGPARRLGGERRPHGRRARVGDQEGESEHHPAIRAGQAPAERRGRRRGAGVHPRRDPRVRSPVRQAPVTRSVRLGVAAGLAALLVALAAHGSSARTALGPFSIAPSPTHECQRLHYCLGIAGLWVVVPATGEATYLFGCPPRSLTKGAFLLGGTDALASSKSVRVWFAGKLGAPIGKQEPGSALLFHAVTTNGKQGSFQPILGCIDLTQASKRSTVSARQAEAAPAPTSAPAPHWHATTLILAPGNAQPASTSCLAHEKLVGSWNAVAYGTSGPPKLPAPGAVKVATHSVRNTVQAQITTASTIPYLIHIQIGAVCEPTS